MAYNATYTDVDVGPATIDTVVKILVAIASIATIIGFVLVYRYITTGHM